MKKFLAAVVAIVLTFGLVACSGNSPAPAPEAKPEASVTPDPAAPADEGPSGTLVVYSSHDADPLNEGLNMFMEKYPDIQVEVVAAGTGELCNRIKAESVAPIADVMWGGGGDSLAAFKEYFQPYVCANDAFIDDAYKDKDDLWIGDNPLPMVIFFNKDLLDRDGLPIPQAWEDLTEPIYKGKIAYCLPSKSGSAYTQLCTMLFAHGGTEDGWQFIEQLYDNLDGKMVDSSSKCHKMVADGEFHIGLSLENSVVKYEGNDSVGFVYPSDGTSAVPGAIALVKDCPNEENAKLFIDFVTSYESQKAQYEHWGRRSVRNDIEVTGSMAKLSDIALVDYDFDWAAANKEMVVERFNDIMVG